MVTPISNTLQVYGKPPFTGRCGLNCGWDNGEDCRQCQESLFHSIQQCNLTFDPNINVSLSVKELISNLLVKDSHKRYTIVYTVNFCQRMLMIE